MKLPTWMSKKVFWSLVAVKTVIKIVIVVGLYHSAQAKADSPAAPAQAQCTRYQNDIAPTGCTFFISSQTSRTSATAHQNAAVNSIEFQFFAERTAPEQVYFRALKHFRQSNGQFRADCMGNQMPAGSPRCGMNFDDFMHNHQHLATDLNQTYISWMTGMGGQAMPGLPNWLQQRVHAGVGAPSAPAIGALMLGIGTVAVLSKIRVVRQGMEATAEGEARAAAAASRVSQAERAAGEGIPTAADNLIEWTLERWAQAGEGTPLLLTSGPRPTVAVRSLTMFRRAFNGFMDWLTNRRSVQGVGAFARLLRKAHTWERQDSRSLIFLYLMEGAMVGTPSYYFFKSMINENLNNTRFLYEQWLAAHLLKAQIGVNTVHGRDPNIALLGMQVSPDGTMSPVDLADGLIEQADAVNNQADAADQPAAQSTSGLVTQAPRPAARQARPNLIKMPDMNLVEQSTRAYFQDKNQCLGLGCQVGFFEPDYTTAAESPMNEDLTTPVQAP